MKYIINAKDYSNEVKGLTNFARKRFGFSQQPKILFDDDVPNSHKTLGKTGHYDPGSMQIHIYATGRHIKDILRSLAHELVHHMQNENGELSHDGYMGQGYAQKNPHMREMEKQAYEMGNLCFRDWEDSLKQKHPTIYNERRNHQMSLKDWKNKELNENLNEKWGFKMKLNEMGMHPGAQQGSIERMNSIYGAEPPLAPEEYIDPEECEAVDPVSGECLDPPEESPCAMAQQENPSPMGSEMPRDVPFQESLNRKIRVKIKK